MNKLKLAATVALTTFALGFATPATAVRAESVSNTAAVTTKSIENPELRKAVEWGLLQQNAGITYSMYGARNGSDGTMDCSGFVSTALQHAGVNVELTSTVGLLQKSNALGQTGTTFKQVDINTAKAGTLVVVGGLDGYSSGGHTFFLLEDYHGDETRVLECSYGANGINSNGIFLYASMYNDEVVALVPNK